MMSRDNDATITVFLSLVLFLILAFLTVTVEAARVNAAKNYTYQLFDLASSSVLADYNLPLYTEYHIFGLDAGFGSASLSKEKIQEQICESMQYTLTPLKNTSDNLLFPKDSFLLWNIGVGDCKVTEITSLLDFDGSLFYQEAVDYMKYREIAKGAEFILDQVSLLKETDTSANILQEKLKVEEQLAVIDVSLLELLELIDGISFENGQILTNRNGDVQCADNFVKQINVDGITSSGVGINHPQIFSVLQNRYYQPILELENIKINGITYDQLVVSEKEILEEKRSLEEEITTNEQISQMSTTSKVSEDSLELEESTDHITDRLEEIEEQIEMIQKEKEKREKDSIIWNTRRIETTQKILEVLHKTLVVIEEIQKEQKILVPIVEKFQKVVEQSQGVVGNEFYEEISNSLSDMKCYVGIGEDNDVFKFDLEAIKVTLEFNVDILGTALDNSINNLPGDEEGVSQSSWIEGVQNLQSIYQQYSYKNLIFDYSDIQFKTQKTDLTQNITTLLQDGLLGIVFENMDSISNAEIKKELLPTTWKNYSEEGRTETLENIDFDINSNSDFIEGCSDELGISNASDILGSMLQTLAEKILYIEYLREHFTNYNVKEKGENQVLDYELEYIIGGKSSDKDNITSIVLKLLGIRVLMNMVYVITDRKMTSEAGTMASLIVGFSGLPFLVSIVKYLILFIWALEQSIIEVTALFQGKKVTFIPTKSSFCVQLSELLLMSKDRIHKKAKELKADGISFDYDSYLMVFLLLQSKEKQIFRSLDIIQENLRLRYTDDFLMQNCVFGYRVDLQIEMPQMFLELPFLNKIEDRGIYGYGFNLTYSTSY